MTSDEVRERLRQACQLAGSAKLWALAHGISTSYVSEVLSGRSEPGAKIIGAFGLERSVDYVPVDSRKNGRTAP